MKVTPQKDHAFNLYFGDFTFSGVQSVQVELPTPDTIKLNVEYLLNPEDAHTNLMATQALLGELPYHKTMPDKIGHIPFGLTLQDQEGYIWKSYLVKAWVCKATPFMVTKTSSEQTKVNIEITGTLKVQVNTP